MYLYCITLYVYVCYTTLDCMRTHTFIVWFRKAFGMQIFFFSCIELTTNFALILSFAYFLLAFALLVCAHSLISTNFLSHLWNELESVISFLSACHNMTCNLAYLAFICTCIFISFTLNDCGFVFLSSDCNYCFCWLFPSFLLLFWHFSLVFSLNFFVIYAIFKPFTFVAHPKI